MARLRREEEARSYERMLNPPLPTQSFSQRFPSAPYAHLFPDGASTAPRSAADDDDVTFADINRQLTLIINILVSIVACSIAIWMVASHWSAPARLGLSMGGGGLVGVAEVVVYSGYLRRVREAKDKEKKKVEVKTVMESWVIEGKKDKGRAVENKQALPELPKDAELRRRRTKTKQ